MFNLYLVYNRTKTHSYMKKSIALIGVLAFLIPVGQPLVIGNTAAFMSAAVILSVSKNVQLWALSSRKF